MTMELQPIEGSTQFEAAAYDPEKSALHVQFTRGGGTYIYKDVPPDVAAEFRAAESLGRYHGANIRGKYEFEKVEVAKEAAEPQ